MTTDQKDRLTFYRQALENCPPPSQTVDGLIGWAGGTLSPVCVRCTSRLSGRGVDTNDITINAIWTDGRESNYGSCQLCNQIMSAN